MIHAYRGIHSIAHCNICRNLASFPYAPAIPTKTAVLCPVEEDTVWRIQWSPATPGFTQSARCPGEGGKTGLGLARRSCLEGGVWGSVDASNCESVAIRDIRIQVGTCAACGKLLFMIMSEL